MKKIAIEELEIGLSLSKDIYNDLGNIILAQGTEILNRHIEYFRSHGIQHIFIDEEEVQAVIPEITKVKPSNKHRDINSYYAAVLEQFKKMYLQIQNKNTNFDIQIIVHDLKPLIDLLILDNDVLGTMRLLAFREDYHFTHAINVSMLGAMLGKWLGLSKSMIYNIALTGLLYDIGKTQVPQELLFKTEKLTEYEMDQVRAHSTLGYDLLKDNPSIPKDVLAAVLFHHERSDGRGYPSGLKEDKTPYLARIIGVVDVFDAVTSDRIYKKGVSSFQAFNIMKDESFKGLDPKITDVFMSNIASFFINNKVKLNDGRIGEVVYINKYALNRPLIQMENDFVDLSTDYSLEIAEVLMHKH